MLEEIKHMYIIFGLDITTLKIKDMEKSSEREVMLGENMDYLRKRYPDYIDDPYVKNMSFKKRLIFILLSQGHYRTVLRIYDR